MPRSNSCLPVLFMLLSGAIRQASRISCTFRIFKGLELLIVRQRLILVRFNSFGGLGALLSRHATSERHSAAAKLNQ